MNENIDLTKILEGCPKRTEFYHAGYGRVWFVGIDLYSDHPIRLSTVGGYIADVSVTKKGTFTMHHNGECLFFPSKDQRDWSKFERFWDKPKIERFDIHTLQPFDKMLFRLGENPWRCVFFSHILLDDCDKEIVCTTDGLSVRCIPYNDDTKHLCGKTDDCPDYYKWWEE